MNQSVTFKPVFQRPNYLYDEQDLRSIFSSTEVDKLRIPVAARIGTPPSLNRKPNKATTTIKKMKKSSAVTTYHPVVSWELPKILLPEIPEYSKK
jgi:hypothetical protein